MANIRVVAENNVKADKVEEFLALARVIVKKTHENDEGCVAYDLFKDQSNPNKFVMLEEWTSNEALKKHMESAHFKEIIPQFGPLCEKGAPPSVFEKAL